MPAAPMPSAEVDVHEDLVRALLADQHPDLAGRTLRLAANGWDNAVWRLGDDLAVRLPRRELAAALVRHEQRWLPELAPRLPLPVPVPVRTGAPALGYPWHWSVVPWLAGVVALDAGFADPADAAGHLGAFVAALHQPAPPDAPANPYRGVPLAERDEVTRTRIDALADELDGTAIGRRWQELSSAAPWEGPALWLHGDLHPGNLLVTGGRLSGVIDFGDLTAGDPASDLAVAWMAFPQSARPAFRAAAGRARGVDDATWQRAEAWALALGVAILANSADNPPYRALARRTIEAVLND